MRAHLIPALFIIAAAAGAGSALADPVGRTHDEVRSHPDRVRTDEGPGLSLSPRPRPTQPTGLDATKLSDLISPPAQPSADAAIDALLGVLPGAPQAQAGAKHIYVDENGDLACVTLDTFFPEPC
ncbi:MAG: hypothetical protein ACFCVH_05790 [Alphaproteobacteria bacterium]